MIPEILKKTQLFRGLSDQQLSEICQQLVEKEYLAGRLVVQLGEVGDCLYLILSGSAQVFVYDKDGKEIVLARLEKGQFFGEQALLNEKPIRRNANVRALTSLKTLALSHATFQTCLNAELRDLLKGIGEAELISRVTNELQERGFEQKELMALLGHQRVYAPRDVFFRQGDVPDCAYYLLSGSVEIRIYDKDRRVKSLSIIYPGQFFGELAILEDSPRAAIAVALVESKVASIDADQLKEFCNRNTKLKSLFTAQRRLYQIPSLGIVTQFATSIEGLPALATVIQKESGETILASRLLNSSFFAIYYEGISGSKQIFKDKENRSREILVVDHRLVGVISIGDWGDLGEISRLVYEKPILTSKDLENFHLSGIVSVSSRALTGTLGNVCECMQVKIKTIQDCILNGASTVDEVARRTGAGTVCGGCRPRILEMLGGNAWTYVKVIRVQEHSPKVKSFQFQPLNGSFCHSEPGQHVVIEAFIDGYWVARSYTLTSIAQQNAYYEITVKKEDQGLFSRWLFANHMKDPRLRISAPQGTFIFDPEKEAPAVCFMAGIGVTPAIAFIRALVSRQSKRRFYLDYSVHETGEIVFQREMADCKKQHSNLEIRLRVTSQSGRLKKEEIQEILKEYPESDIYICGPNSYEQNLLEILKMDGMLSEKIHKEEFNHAAGSGERVQ